MTAPREVWMARVRGAVICEPVRARLDVVGPPGWAPCLATGGSGGGLPPDVVVVDEHDAAHLRGGYVLMVRETGGILVALAATTRAAPLPIRADMRRRWR